VNIGGLLKNSMIDYPGKLSCGIFLSGCNFNCPYCHNPHLAKDCSMPFAESDLQNIYRFIENRMDLKTDPLKYATYIQPNCNVSAIISSIEIIMASSTVYEFRTTCVKPIVTEEVIENICRLIEGADLYALQRFHKSEMLHPDFFKDASYEYAINELVQLKAIAEPWVKRCIVR
jgi:pyruvate-formate lyase-activating enzyme